MGIPRYIQGIKLQQGWYKLFFSRNSTNSKHELPLVLSVNVVSGKIFGKIFGNYLKFIPWTQTMTSLALFYCWIIDTSVTPFDDNCLLKKTEHN